MGLLDESTTEALQRAADRRRDRESVRRARSKRVPLSYQQRQVQQERKR